MINDSWIIRVRQEYLKSFNWMHTNELWLFLKYYLQIIRLQIIYMYKQDLILNNLHGLICHKANLYK